MGIDKTRSEAVGEYFETEVMTANWARVLEAI